MRRLFGTDGVRGVANTELTCELAYQLGRAGAFVLAGENHHKPRILVGKDTRKSGDMLEKSLIAGICSSGADAVTAGFIPTPAVAYLVRKYNFDAGVVISASHNSAEFNGIKFFNSQGLKLSDDIEKRIEAIILDGSEEVPFPVGKDIGTSSILDTAGTDYANFAKSTINCSLEGLRVAIDCANGASYKVAPEAIKSLGAQVFAMFDNPDGLNINHKCGSTHMESIMKHTIENKCHIGLAFDGDADRVLAVDENGELVDGDKILSIIGLSMKNKGILKDNTIVATVMSNLGFDHMAKQNGLNIVKTAVGDRYVLEQMIQDDYLLGGEQSGHIIIKNYNTTGDGLVTALQILQVLKESGKKLSELASVMTVFPQVLKNAYVSNDNKNKYMDDSLIAQKCLELEQTFHGEGRVLIRASGTEPLVRVMIEGRDQDYINNKALELVKIIEKCLG